MVAAPTAAFLLLIGACAMAAAGAVQIQAHGAAVGSVQVGEQAARRALRDGSGLLEALAGDLARLERGLHGGEPGRSLSAKALLQLPPKRLGGGPPPAKMLEAKEAMEQMTHLGPAQLPAMAGLLEGMYQTWKEKIGQVNRREQEQKRAFESAIRELEAKKAAAGGTASAVDTYERIEKYWRRQRDISHHQYHTALKIMHSGMAQFKSVEEAMRSAAAGKKPTAKDLHAAGMMSPDVVLLQERVVALAAWAREASGLVLAARQFGRAREP